MLKYIISSIIAATSFVSQPLQNTNGFRPAWGLDRIDQREAALNDTYNYRLDGTGVTVYVFDSGINPNHEDFGGRVAEGFSSVPDGNGTNDCSGHGTHSASLIGGARYGVAKNVTLVPVRVLNCTSSGSSSYIYPAINWIIQHHQAGAPAIVNMSIGSSRSIPLNDAVRALIADGLIVVSAAGNQNRDACLYSPASELSAISVGAIDRYEARASYSNFGSCVDIFAPGSDMVGAWFDSTNSYRSSSGTSNAAPLVSGIVAMMLQENPSLTQAQVESMLIANSTQGVLANVGANSPNLLAHSIFEPLSASPTPAPTTTQAPPVTQAPVNTQAPAPTQAPVTTVSPVVTQPQPVSAVPAELVCKRARTRIRINRTPYVCVNTGNGLMWVMQRYSKLSR